VQPRGESLARRRVWTPEGHPIANYWGLEQIARRMEVDSTTIRRWHREKGFLMMQRRRKINRMWYAVWYTNDALILAWEREQCIRQAKELAQ
jgi:hypothetical protein